MKYILMMLLLTASLAAFSWPRLKHTFGNETIVADSNEDSSMYIVAQPKSQSVEAGKSVTFKVMTSGGPYTNTYQWKINGSDIPGATDSIFTIPGATRADTGKYSVAVTEFMGEYSGTTKYSDSALLTVNDISGGTTGFTFTVPDTSSMTSAGIYDQNDNLVRTMWSGIRYPAGTFDTTWDGKDDQGKLLSDGSYTAKVTTNNMYATWLGVIGNNSDSTHGSSVWRQQNACGMVFPTNTYGYVPLTITEGSWPIFKFNTSTIHQKADILFHTTYQTNNAIATDGKLVYVATCQPFPGNSFIYFVYALDPTTDKLYSFANGKTVDNGPFAGSYSALDTTINVLGTTLSPYNANRITTCVAVQRNGNNLFVGRGDRIDIYNKVTGALIATSTMTGANKMVCDYNGQLWVIFKNTVKKYQVNSNGSLRLLLTLSGNNYPMALDINPTGNTLVTIDGSTQQVKAYDNSTGLATWTLGQLNGYYVSPKVANDKFYFKDDRGDYPVFVSYQPDGTFWVGDEGNNRMIHFSAAKTYLDQIIYQPATYFASIDGGNPTHAWAGYMRFDIDYTNPLKLVAPLTMNYGARRTYTNIGSFRDFSKPAAYKTLSNGKCYTFNLEYNVSGQQLFEVTDTGFRKTGYISGIAGLQMDYNGNLFGFNYVAGIPFDVLINRNNGFDANNNPTYSTGFQNLEHIPNPTALDLHGVGSLTSRLSDSTLVLYDNGKDQNYHLGFLKHGSPTMSKRTMNSTNPSYTGEFPTNGYYDIGNGVNYAGGADVVDDDIVYAGYRGENWSQAQTNKWDMFDKNALFLGQFGVTTKESSEEAPYGMAGNVMHADVIHKNGFTYLFHQDESLHAGLHYWAVYNRKSVATSVHALVKSGTPVITKTYTGLNDGLARIGTLAMNDSSGWIRSSPENTTTIAWQVNSGLHSYDYNDAPDITAMYNFVFGGDSIMTVTKSLGTVTNTNWAITGKIDLGITSPNKYNSYAIGYLQVLDDKGKIIAQFSENQSSTNGADITGNDKVISSYSRSSDGASIVGTTGFAPFTIAATGNTLTFSYGTNTATTTKLVDSNAVISRAASFRIFFEGITYTFQKSFSLKNLRFTRQ